MDNYKVEKMTECLVISFLEVAERNDFVQNLKNSDWLKEDGYMTTRTFFAILGNGEVNPYKGISLMWNKEEIEEKIKVYVDHNVDLYRFVVEIPHPHPHKDGGAVVNLSDFMIKDNNEAFEIGFITPNVRDCFYEAIMNHERMQKYGCVYTPDVFRLLGCKNPFAPGIGWWAEDLNKAHAINNADYRKAGGYEQLLILPNPHSLVREEEQEPAGDPTDQKKLVGIDDGGERMVFESGALREPATGKGRFDLVSPFGLRRIAMWYELGALKYAERNWEKGIPMSRCVDSAMRHLNKFLMGMTDEDHLAAAAWNVIAIMHYEETGRTDLDDLPHFIKNLPESAAKPLELVDEMHD